MRKGGKPREDRRYAVANKERNSGNAVAIFESETWFVTIGRRADEFRGERDREKFRV